MKRVLSVLLLSVFLVLAMTAQVLAADQLQIRDQDRDQLRDGSCLAHLQDQDRDRDRLRDGSCKLAA